MSYSDIDPDYYAERDRQKIQQIMNDEATAMMHYINRERQNAGLLPLPPPSMDMTMLEMQFADPDWQPDPRSVLKLDPSTHEGRVEASPRGAVSAKQLFSASGNPWSDFTIVTHMPEADPDVNTQVEVPELMYTESSNWVSVPFYIPWILITILLSLAAGIVAACETGMGVNMTFVWVSFWFTVLVGGFVATAVMRRRHYGRWC